MAQEGKKKLIWVLTVAGVWYVRATRTMTEDVKQMWRQTVGDAEAD